MLKPLVVAALLFPYKRLVSGIAIAVFFIATSSVCQAEPRYIPVSVNQQQKYLAKVELNTAAELETILHQIEQWSESQKPVVHPVVIILHGPEAKSLLKKNYTNNKTLIDLAESLNTREVIRIRVCKTWMKYNDFSEGDFVPFIDTIPYAPSEIKRLMSEEGYTYF